jgi:hypothetical protein
MNTLKRHVLTLVAASLIAAVAHAAEPTAPVRTDVKDGRTLDGQIQTLKQDVMELNRDLLVLEEELLFPASTQVAVFVSLDVGALFALDSVQLKVDNSVVAHYLYTERELKALQRGGVQRLYLGNLKAGKHELVAVFTGKGPHDRDYRRATSLSFDKATGPKYLELQIRDESRNLQPEFRVKEWQ